MPAGTVVDVEVVAIDESGRPYFNLLQNFRADASRTPYYIFDLLRWKDRDFTRVPMIEPRALLKSLVSIPDERIITSMACSRGDGALAKAGNSPVPVKYLQMA